MMEEMVVNSVRGSLISAQEIKQNSTEVVDSIVAQDIGKLPDDSVADALQRVPGVQVGRGAGEIGTVLIRGLPNIGTTLNGNEIFTGTSRGVALQDIPAELVSGIDVYKSTSPDKIEGGIAGLVDIRLRRPFDFEGQRVAGSARVVHGDSADKNSYYLSGLYSNRWKLDGGGELGILYSGAYQQRYYADQTAFNFLFEPVGVPAGLVSGQTTLQLPFTQGSLLTPTDRKRYAHDLSIQWKASDDWEIYNDFLSTTYIDNHQVYFLIGFPRFGAFTAATVYPGTNVPMTTTSTNNFQLTSMQAFRQRTNGYHDVLGAKWSHDRMTWTTEFLYDWNKFSNQALIVDTRFGPPTPGTFTFNYNNDGQADLKITGADITSVNNFYLWGLFDNRDHSRSEQKGGRTDLTWKPSSSDSIFTAVSAGLRWTDRDVRFRASSRNDISPAGATNGDRFAPTVPNISTISGFGTVSPDGPLSYGTPHWVTANPDYLYSHQNEVRALFNVPQTEPTWNPTLGFSDKEKVFAGYLNGKFSTTLSDMPFDGSVGVRVARTSQSLEGYRTDETRIDSDKSSTDVLPVINARLKFDERTQLRFSAGRTITRPNFSDLNPAVTLNAPTTTGGAAGTGSGGNPDLDPVTSDNFDLSLEYYFGKGSYVSFTPFYRSIDGYVQTFAATETIAGVNYIVTRPRNAGKGHLDGFEATYQHFPEFTNFLEGFGWQLNYTYIDGNQDVADPTSTANPPARTRLPYEQVSKSNYNVVLIYEKSKFSARLAYNWRGRYVDTFNGPNAPTSGLRTITAKPTDELDFSASYNINDNITITLDATNLLDRQYQDYFTDASRYPRDTRAFDRTIGLGARFRF